MVQVQQAAAIVHPHAEANAVEASQVGGGFRRGQQIVGGYRIFGMRQRDFLPDGAQILEHLQGGQNRVTDGGVNALADVFLRHGDAQSFDISGQGAQVIGDIHFR
ncbi:hypothetical protein D3C71_1206650 [compost metagenome]